MAKEEKSVKLRILLYKGGSKNYQINVIPIRLGRMSFWNYPSLKVHCLNDEWEFYLDIHYRYIFQWKNNEVTLLTIGTHKIVNRYII